MTLNEKIYLINEDLISIIKQNFIKIETIDNWYEFNDQVLRIEWLKKYRGVSNKKCIWKECENYSLNDLYFCEFHAYINMGVRK